MRLVERVTKGVTGLDDNSNREVKSLRVLKEREVMKESLINGIWTITVQDVVTFKIDARNGTDLTKLNKIRQLAKRLRDSSKRIWSGPFKNVHWKHFD